MLLNTSMARDRFLVDPMHTPNVAAENAAVFGRAQDLVFISAQTSAPELPDGWRNQLELTIGRLVAALSEAGVTPAAMVKIGLFYEQSLVEEETEIIGAIRKAFGDDVEPVLSAIPLPAIPHGALLQIEAIAIDPAGKRSAKVTHPDLNGFSRVVRADDLIFVAAHMSVDESGKTQHEGDVVAQAEATISNIRQALDLVGADLSCVVKLNTYYVGTGTTEDWTRAARVRSDAFVKPGPGATGVPVPGPYPAGILVRQEVIGIVNSDGTAAARRTSWPKGVWDWPIPVSFEQGLELNDLIISGGQIPSTTSGDALFTGNLGQQTINTMGCIASILGGLGQNVDCLGKVTIFYATNGHPDEVEAIMSRVAPFFASGLPALTLVPLKRLGISNVDIEIEGIGSI